MKTKITLMLTGLLLSSSLVFSQATESCIITGSDFIENAKIRNYEAAYAPFMKLRKECPAWSLALYQHGEKLLKSRIKKASDATQKKTEVNDLIKLYEERLHHYPSKTKKGNILTKIAQLKYDNKIGDMISQYLGFHKAQTEDSKNFKSPKGLYTYFSLLVDLHKDGQKEAQEVFDLYDIVIQKIEAEQNKWAKRIAPLTEKEDIGESLSQKEAKTLKTGDRFLSNYGKIKGSVDAKLGDIADCKNLIPLFNKDFEAMKNDLAWIKKAARRLSAKDCTDSDLFITLVEQLDRLAPSAKTKLYLGQLEKGKGNMARALQYWEESAQMETDPNAKASLYYRIAEDKRSKGQYSQAKRYYNKALANKPSFGICYLRIADMYAKSANSCGTTVFEKRAVYWLAAQTARKAARVDASLSRNAKATANAYQKRAPSKTEIFQGGMQGKRIPLRCWIGGSVKVPNL